MTTAGISSQIKSGEIVCREDGTYVFWPTGAHGYFTSSQLREIADHFDMLNYTFNKEIENYFDNSPKVG